MSNVRIDNPAGRPPITTSNQSVGDVAGKSSGATGTPPKTEDHPQSDSKSAGALRRRGNEVKSQQHITAKLLQQELGKHIGNVPSGAMTFEKDAGNDKLAKIHVQREVHTTPPKQKYVKEYVGHEKNPINHLVGFEDGKETSTTRFPNGVGIKTESYIEADGNKKGVVSAKVQPPPGGKVVQTPGGGLEIYDKGGKKVGELTLKEGGDELQVSLVVHAKEGEYVQSGDGEIKFTPNRK